MTFLLDVIPYKLLVWQGLVWLQNVLSLLRQLPTITAGGKYFGKLMGGPQNCNSSQGGQQKHFVIFYLKYECKLYGMTWNRDVAKMFDMFKGVGAQKLSTHLKWAMDIVTIRKHFKPFPLLILVDNSLSIYLELPYQPYQFRWHLSHVGSLAIFF